MSPLLHPEYQGKASFPRVSGDEPTVEAGKTDALTFSPRERG